MDSVDQLAQLEATIVGVRDRISKETRQAEIDWYVAELVGMTTQLETIQKMEVSEIITNETAATLRRAVAAIQNCIGAMYLRNADVFDIVLSPDEIVALDPIFSRYATAVHKFEARALTIITGLEKFEKLTGVRNQ